MKNKRIFVSLMILALLAICYGIEQQGERIGFYKGCQSIGLDMIPVDGGYICDNLTAINMEIAVINPLMYLPLIIEE